MSVDPTKDFRKLLEDEEVRERHREDLSRALEVLREISEGPANQAGIGGQELRDFIDEHG